MRTCGVLRFNFCLLIVMKETVSIFLITSCMLSLHTLYDFRNSVTSLLNERLMSLFMYTHLHAECLETLSSCMPTSVELFFRGKTAVLT